MSSLPQHRARRILLMKSQLRSEFGAIHHWSALA